MQLASCHPCDAGVLILLPLLLLLCSPCPLRAKGSVADPKGLLLQGKNLHKRGLREKSLAHSYAAAQKGERALLLVLLRPWWNRLLRKMNAGCGCNDTPIVLMALRAGCALHLQALLVRACAPCTSTHDGELEH
jgi:hypothetical protein